MTRHLHGCGLEHDCQMPDPLQPSLPGQEGYSARWRRAHVDPRATRLAGSVVRNWVATGEGFLPGLIERVAAGMTALRPADGDELTPAEPVAPGRLLTALAEGSGTHDCPACNRGTGPVGVLADGRTCPLCAGWGAL